METQNIFADYVHVSRPEFLIQRIITSIPERRNIIRERIAPDIHDLRRITRHRNTEALRPLGSPRPRETDILKSPLYEREYLLLPAARNYLQLIALNPLFECVSIF